MRVTRFILTSAGVVLLGLPSIAVAGPKATTKAHPLASVKHSSSASSKHTSGASVKRTSSASVKHTSGKRNSARNVVSHRAPVAVVMPAERATQIQTALIKQGYLTGEPTGTWDAQSISAMQKLQADNGWQSKVTPDSRALIKLGLGPETPGGGPEASNTVAQTQPQK